MEEEQKLMISEIERLQRQSAEAQRSVASLRGLLDGDVSEQVRGPANQPIRLINSTIIQPPPN